MGACSPSKEAKVAAEERAQSRKRIDHLERTCEQIAAHNASRMEGEISFLRAALTAFANEQPSPAKTILEERLKVLVDQRDSQAAALPVVAAAPSLPEEQDNTNDAPSEQKPAKAHPLTEEPLPGGSALAGPDISPDHPFFCHERGVAQTLAALQERGDAAEALAPLQEEFENVLREANSEAYDSIVDSEHLKVAARQDAKSKFMVIRTTDVIPGAHVKELFRLCHDTALRVKWEKKFMGSDKHVHVIKEFEGHKPWEHEVFLFQYPGMMFVKGREFLDRRCTFSDEDRGIYLVVQGVAHGVHRAPNKKYIRAATTFQCTMCYAVPGGAAVYNCILADPGGSLSTSMVNHQSKVHPTKWHKALVSAYKAIADKTMSPVSPEGGAPSEAQPPGSGHNRSRSQSAEEPEHMNPLARSASSNDVTKCSPHLTGAPMDTALERRIAEDSLRLESSPRHMHPAAPAPAPESKPPPGFGVEAPAAFTHKDKLVAMINDAESAEIPSSPTNSPVVVEEPI